MEIIKYKIKIYHYKIKQFQKTKIIMIGKKTQSLSKKKLINKSQI